MNGRGFRADALHGGMDQQQRDQVMGRLRSGATELLLATDVAARGLDIDHLTHVFNYEVPSAAESYVHRIGRVGRAGRAGVAITLVDPRERRLLGNIEHLTKQPIAIESVPSVAQLRALRLDQTLATIREAAATEQAQLDQFRSVVETLAEESELMQIALAAVKLVHEASGANNDEQEIPDLSASQQRGRSPAAERKAPSPKKKARKGTSSGYERKDQIQHGKQGRLFVGIGKSKGVRPQDLVGAIAGESRLRGTDIGAITVNNHYCVVEVPAAAIDDVVRSMARTTIKGNKAKVRRYTDEKTK